MARKRMDFPMEVKQGSVTVRIYRVENRRRASFTVSYHADGKRHLKMFASFDEALADAKAKANALARGELDALHLRAVDARAYVNALDLLDPVGVPLELAVKDYVEAWKVLGGRASLLEAAREFARRHMNDLPDKMLPAAVDEMLAIREKDGTSDAYLKVLKVYLKQLKEKFHCQLRAVTTGQLSDYFRNMDVSPRSKNNARATVGAFFTFCKERGWLARDHEGVSLVQKFKERPTDITIYSPWEVAQFLRFARTDLVPFIAIGAFAGLRTAEIGRLDWTEVHLKERFIEIKAAKSKTASRRLVPISDNLAKWLRPHVQEHGRVVPFDNIPKQISWLVEDTNDGLEKAAQGAGKDPAKARQVKWKKNALRHSFISYRVAETQDVAQVALEAGNSPQIIFEHYRELVRLKEAQAWFALTPENVKESVEMAKEALTA
jgi:site-specific recombinase XerD